MWSHGYACHARSAIAPFNRLFAFKLHAFNLHAFKLYSFELYSFKYLETFHASPVPLAAGNHP